jgi:hypothetical protein
LIQIRLRSCKGSFCCTQDASFRPDPRLSRGNAGTGAPDLHAAVCVSGQGFLAAQDLKALWSVDFIGLAREVSFVDA